MATPNHYQGANGIDVIDFIEQQRGTQAAFEFCIGNVTKYAIRIGRKFGEGTTKDLDKIIDYANRAKAINRGIPDAIKNSD
jgi:hypothetical protein